MKRKYLFISLVAGAVAFSSCKEKTTTSSSSGSSSAPADQGGDVAPKPEPMKSTASVEDRAAKLGFAKHMPKNLVSYEAMFNGRDAFEQLLKTPIGEFILERMADEGITLEDLAESEQMSGQLAMYGEEYFAAYGEGTTESFDLALKLFERALYYGARTGVFAADAQVREGGEFEPESPAVLLDGPLKGAIKEAIAIFAKAEMPSFYQGAKVSDDEARELVALQMEQGIAALQFIAGEAVEEISIERDGNEFAGYKVSGAKLVEMMEAEDGNMAAMEEFVDSADIADFKESLAKKNLVAVSGVVGDYVILFVGKSEDDLVFADKAEDSVCANEKMVFIDSYLDKDIFYAGFSDAELMNNVGNLSGLGYRMIGAAVSGASKGLSEARSLGDTRDVEALLESLASQGQALAKLFSASDAGYVFYLEDGIKAESYGGSNMPNIDFGKTHTFAPMATGESTLLFANWTSNEAYNQKVMEYVDTLGETSYMVSKRITALDIDDGDLRQFKEGLDLFDQNFRGETLELWKALREDLSAGLGAESALIVDVNGSFPKVPQVPQVILKEGKVPRIAYVSQVSDRAKLQGSWERINTSAENILKKISEMQGDEIPMQEPMSSEKGDLKTWFIPIPFQNNDFVPSVSVSDELFFASTSKTFSEGLAAKFKEGGGTSRDGAWMHVDFTVLNAYAQQCFKLLEDNADDVFPDEDMRDDIIANRDKIKKALKALETLKKMTMHTRSEGGRTRVSLHMQAN